MASGIHIPPPLAMTYLGVGWSPTESRIRNVHVASGLPLGEPSPNRTIIVALPSRISNGHQFASITIAGVEAVIDHQTPTWPSAIIARATVPEGTVGDVEAIYTTPDWDPMFAAVYATPGPVEVVGKGAQYNSAAPTVTIPTTAGGAFVACYGNTGVPVEGGFSFGGWDGREPDQMTARDTRAFMSTTHGATDGTPQTLSVSHTSHKYSGLVAVSYQSVPPQG